MRKFFLALHKWLSLPVGIIIVITCLSGSVLVFQDEIREWAHPERYFVNTTKQEPIPLEKLIPMVNSQLTDNQVKDVRIESDPKRTYAMGLAEGFRVTAYVNQYTGQITDIFYYRESPFFVVMSLHRWLLDDTRTWGKYSVGISTLIFVFILMTGVIIWFPKKLKKRSFTIQRKKGFRRLIYDLHSVLGVYAFLILFVGAVTGLMWSFEWYRNGVFRLFGAEVPARQSAQSNAKSNTKEPDTINIDTWQSLANELTKQNPGYKYIRIQDGSAVVHQKNAPNSRATDKYEFDNQTGEITCVTLFKDQDKVTKIWAWTYSLHFGNLWGIWSKILTFIGGLIGASLPVTGYYLWLKKKRKKKKK